MFLLRVCLNLSNISIAYIIEFYCEQVDIMYVIYRNAIFISI